MNYKTNWYGAVGLISTLGKNSFAAGETVCGLAKSGFHNVQKLVEIDAAVIGPVFNRLENAFKSIEEFDKSAKEWFQVKETSYNEKWEKAKREEDWKEVNEKYAHVERKPRVRINLEEDILECMIRPKKTYLPSCFSSWRRV